MSTALEGNMLAAFILKGFDWTRSGDTPVSNTDILGSLLYYPWFETFLYSAMVDDHGWRVTGNDVTSEGPKLVEFYLLINLHLATLGRQDGIPNLVKLSSLTSARQNGVDAIRSSIGDGNSFSDEELLAIEGFFERMLGELVNSVDDFFQANQLRGPKGEDLLEYLRTVHEDQKHPVKAAFAVKGNEWKSVTKILTSEFDERENRLGEAISKVHVAVRGKVKPIIDLDFHPGNSMAKNEQSRLLELACYRHTVEAMIPLKNGNVRLEVMVQALEEIYHANNCSSRLYPSVVLDAVEAAADEHGTILLAQLHELAVYLLFLISAAETQTALTRDFMSGPARNSHHPGWSVSVSGESIFEPLRNAMLILMGLLKNAEVHAGHEKESTPQAQWMQTARVVSLYCTAYCNSGIDGGKQRISLSPLLRRANEEFAPSRWLYPPLHFHNVVPYRLGIKRQMQKATPIVEWPMPVIICRDKPAILSISFGANNSEAEGNYNYAEGRTSLHYNKAYFFKAVPSSLSSHRADGLEPEARIVATKIYHVLVDEKGSLLSIPKLDEKLGKTTANEGNNLFDAMVADKELEAYLTSYTPKRTVFGEKVDRLGKAISKVHMAVGNRVKPIIDFDFHSHISTTVDKQATLHQLKCYRLTVEAMIPLEDGNVHLKHEGDLVVFPTLEKIYLANKCPSRSYPTVVLDAAEAAADSNGTISIAHLHQLTIYLLFLISAAETQTALTGDFVRDELRNGARDGWSVTGENIFEPPAYTKHILKGLLSQAETYTDDKGVSTQWLQTARVLGCYFSADSNGGGDGDQKISLGPLHRQNRIAERFAPSKWIYPPLYFHSLGSCQLMDTRNRRVRASKVDPQKPHILVLDERMTIFLPGHANGERLRYNKRAKAYFFIRVEPLSAVRVDDWMLEGIEANYSQYHVLVDNEGALLKIPELDEELKSAAPEDKLFGAILEDGELEALIASFANNTAKMRAKQRVQAQAGEAAKTNEG